MSRKRFKCLDCSVDTGKIGEHYMLTDETWYQIHDSNIGMLCLGCLEVRLGRKLTAQDFNQSYINGLRFGIKSLRLLDRLASV